MSLKYAPPVKKLKDGTYHLLAVDRDKQIAIQYKETYHPNDKVKVLKVGEGYGVYEKD